MVNKNYEVITSMNVADNHDNGIVICEIGIHGDLPRWMKSYVYTRI